MEFKLAGMKHEYGTCGFRDDGLNWSRNALEVWIWDWKG